MTTELAIDVPRDFWLTSNGRYHWAEKARRTRWLRQLASIRGHGLTLGWDRCQVTAYISYPKGATGRVDPNNCAPTTKALIDGLVDAGLFADDDATRVLGPDHRRAPNTCTADYRVRFVLEEVVEP
jgi:crossover junction endodeoxyribonuclease RusA